MGHCRIGPNSPYTYTPLATSKHLRTRHPTTDLEPRPRAVYVPDPLTDNPHDTVPDPLPSTLNQASTSTPPVSLEVARPQQLAISNYFQRPISATKRHQALKKYITNLSTKDLTSQVNNMLIKLKGELDKRFGANYESNTLLSEATFLDSRFKKYGFQKEELFQKVKDTIINKGPLSPM
ncbi:hypothetical protein ACI65C_008032 [Semiaphis heraclei]